MWWMEMTRKAVLALGVLLGMSSPAFPQSASDAEAVKVTNDAFDAALTARDMRAVEGMWIQEPHAVAVHPASKAPVVGWEAVKKSWEGTFARFVELSVVMKDPSIRVVGDMAWVVGVEAVQGKRPDGVVVSFSAITTNIYERRAGRWLMVVHHASRVPE